MKRLLCPSMMCANYGNLEKEVRALEEAGVDIFHIDVMDGSFVPNFGMGLQDIEYICGNTKIPCDVHLMVVEPAKYVEKFIKLGCQIVYIHPETDPHVTRTLQMIKDAGAKAGIAINPGTSFESVKELLYLCDYVMVMTVNPGFAGQKYIEFVDEKIIQFAKQKDKYGYTLMMDGACSPERVENLSKLGVEGFILGTSSLFNKDTPYKELITNLRKL